MRPTLNAKTKARNCFMLLGILMTSISCNAQNEGEPSLSSIENAVSIDAKKPTIDVDGSGAGNGGGVIRRDGMILTLTQAGIQFTLEEVTDPVLDFPSFTIVQNLIDHLALTDYYKSTLLRGLRPTTERRYFSIPNNQLNPTKRKLLIAQYKALLRQELDPADELALAAITIGKDTFFLPEFNNLSDDIAKASILMHETLWAINPKLQLSKVIRVEMATEKLLRSLPEDSSKWGIIYDRILFKNIGSALQNPNIDVLGVILREFSLGPITLKFPEGTTQSYEEPVFTFNELFGANVLREASVYGELMVSSLRKYWMAMDQLNPQSEIFSKLLEYVDYTTIGMGYSTGGPPNSNGNPSLDDKHLWYGRLELVAGLPDDGLTSLFSKKLNLSDLIPGHFQNIKGYGNEYSSCQIPGYISQVLHIGKITRNWPGSTAPEENRYFYFHVHFHPTECFNPNGHIGGN